MAAWTEQTEEEYLVVTENDTKLLSDDDELKQSPVTLPGGEKRMLFQEAVKTDRCEESFSYTVASQVPSVKPNSEGLNSDTSLPVNHRHPAANSGYVGILTQREEELDFDGGKLVSGDDAQLSTGAPVDGANPSADYSRVREVDGEHTVLLQRPFRQKEASCAAAMTTPQGARAGS